MCMARPAWLSSWVLSGQSRVTVVPQLRRKNYSCFVYQFYPYANYPHIPEVQVDLFWNGSELEGYNVWIVEMRRLVRQWRRERVGGWHHGHGSGPGDDNFNIWKPNPSFGGIWNTFRLLTGDTADEVKAESARANDSESDGKQFQYPGIHYALSVLFSFHGEAEVKAALFGLLLPASIQKWIVICIFSVWLCIRSLLNNEQYSFANLTRILDLFADVLDRSKFDVCGLTDIHKSTYNGNQPHCGELAHHTPTQLFTSQFCHNFSVCYRWITHYQWINKDNT